MNLTAQEIAEHLNLGNTTVKEWSSKFGIPRERRGVKWVYPSEALEIFETVKRLRDDGKGVNTIRQYIHQPPDKEPIGNHQSSDSYPTEARQSTGADSLIIEVERIMEKKFLQHNDLAEKISRATYTIGQQEERIKTLERDLQAAQETVQLLVQPDQLELVKQENEFLKRELSAEKQKSWWQKLFQRSES